jgi:hypothetical protein
MKSTTVQDVTRCSVVEVYQRFGRLYCLHLHGRKVNQGSNQQPEILSYRFDDFICSCAWYDYVSA